MVCNRCIMVVRTELTNLGLEPVEVGLGFAVLSSSLNDNLKNLLSVRLGQFGFSLLDDKRRRLVEQVKNSIVALVHLDGQKLKTNLSDHISSCLGQDYGYISSTFSEIENTTIEKYYITQRIERAKELLVYDELTIKEICFLLNYSSMSHFSNQFKKITGLTPTISNV